VIGNVPFGKYKVADVSNRAYARFSIHNYFFGRALDLVRPGGLVCFITSSHTMDALDDAVREYIGAQAHLLGAIRLPQGHLRRHRLDRRADRHPVPAQAAAGPKRSRRWLKLGTVPDVSAHPQCYERYLQINAWYAEHPQFCIGRIRRESNGYEEVPVAVFEGDLEAALAERIACCLPALTSRWRTSSPAAHVVVPAEAGARPGSYRLHQGRVHRVEGSEMVDVHDQLNATQRARVTGLCAIRDHARALLDAQLADEGDGRLGHLRAMLNGTYDRFVARYGCLSTRANALAFRRDPDYPLLLSLEHYDEESDTARKAALFTRRTLRSSNRAVAGEPAEALAASCSGVAGSIRPTWRGCCRRPKQAVLDALAGAGQVFLDPADGEWKTADDYLSGNVKRSSSRRCCPGGPTSATSTRWNRCSRKTCCRRPSSRAWARCGFRPSTSRRSSRGPGTQGLPGGLLGRSRRLVGEVRRVGSAAEREGDPGIRHLAHERDRAGAVRAQRAGADGARPRSLTDKYFVNPDETLAARRSWA
jgi:hypothetical protein